MPLTSLIQTKTRQSLLELYIILKPQCHENAFRITNSLCGKAPVTKGRCLAFMFLRLVAWLWLNPLRQSVCATSCRQAYIWWDWAVFKEGITWAVYVGVRYLCDIWICNHISRKTCFLCGCSNILYGNRNSIFASATHSEKIWVIILTYSLVSLKASIVLLVITNAGSDN